MTDLKKRLELGIIAIVDKLVNGNIHPITAKIEIINLITELKIISNNTVIKCPNCGSTEAGKPNEYDYLCLDCNNQFNL